MVVGYDKAGKITVILIGDAEETLKRFKEERDKKTFRKVCWIRKMKFDKQKWTDRPEKKVISKDTSLYDGDAGAALLQQELVVEDSAAPAKRGKN